MFAPKLPTIPEVATPGIYARAWHVNPFCCMPELAPTLGRPLPLATEPGLVAASSREATSSAASSLGSVMGGRDLPRVWAALSTQLQAGALRSRALAWFVAAAGCMHTLGSMVGKGLRLCSTTRGYAPTKSGTPMGGWWGR